ncbi:IS200/IS605 family element RNA-guided endonuclease TnpB [Oceanirhabdus sp. W0125-5]|uniref:IS200/IS605 family element RNA-guided endonuclease TnpB n=1 Tax=Oceanirhabdus sp. W0125-5 TaxID=2999116 RepID=UPI0022F3171B|nr:IS200/IS605 family element RNA-guided endonuclease TnpB [Oceanirhabdus sp. W0125-5]WBW99150.1 IS200/IS605 family element RNA-guided endonuclease TnpB [Oceanirhabdus sp. W0125-5]
MKLNKAYKFRIYPNENQIEIIEKSFGCSRYVYNHFLNQRNEIYKAEKRCMKYTEQQNQLPSMKKELVWLKEVDSTSLQMSLRNLDAAFKNFFEGRADRPKFKSKRNNYKTYTSNFVNNNIEIKKDKIKLPKLKYVNAKIHRYVEGRVINATVSKTSSGKYFVSICVETKIEPLKKVSGNVGIDLGLCHFAILSNGEKIQNPKYLKKSLDKLAKEQRKLSSKEKGSNNWNKQRIKVARLHERISNQRLDFIHKLSKRIISDNQVIILEDLSVKNMMKNDKLAQSISDVSWYKFVTILDYKAKWHGRKIHKINRWYPSSKTCNNCGHVLDEMPLHIREWKCPKCDSIHDRDINASRNILKQGLLEIA